MITNIDDNIAKLRQKLDKLDIADNTIIVFMTDNGTAAGYRIEDEKQYGFNAGMRGVKGSEYDGGHRVPCFIYWNNGQIYGGRDIPELAAHIDIMPTLAELCGIPLPQEHLPLDGKSLVPLLTRNAENWEDRYLITDSQRIQVPEKWRKSAVMSNRWRLINGEELYDIQADPGQEKDLAAVHPEQVALMKEAYEKWWINTSTDFDHQPPIIIGTPKAGPVVQLTCHDWHCENPLSPWNQFHIRQGKKGQGYWAIEVAETGQYEVTLNRYPPEAQMPINSSVKGYTMQDEPGIDRNIPAGENLNFVSGWIQAGTAKKTTAEIGENSNGLVMKLDLEKGPTQLMAGFTNEKGEEFGAFYVSLKKL